MTQYSLYRAKDRIDIFGYEQCFNDEDIKELWEKHKILYLRGGILALWIEERENMNPLVHLMGEDDGHIFWDKKKDACFDSYWLDNYINTLSVMKLKLTE